MFGEKIMVISPLLKWYVQHGLKMTKIHQVVEYLGVLVDKTANVHWQVQMDGLLAHFHFEGLGTQLVTCCYIRVIHNHFESDKVCQRLVTGRWFSSVSFTNTTARHDIAEIMFKV
jgi:hypothetical protein